MSGDPSRRDRLDQLRRPVAIVHEGIFVYANPEFCRRLGYARFEDLEPMLLLDLVPEYYQPRLKEHLARAQRTPGTAETPPQTKVAFYRPDGSHFMAIVTGHRTRFDDEEGVELHLRTREDISLARGIRNLPWRFYLSSAFLAALVLLPSLLLLRLHINNAPRTYFPADAPAVIADARLRQEFPSDQVILLLFEGVALFSDGFLRAYDDLASRIEADPLVDKVLALTRQDHIGGTAGGFEVTPLIDVERLDESRPAQRLQRVLGDRFAPGSLVARDGSAVAMVVVPVSTNSSFQRLDLMRFVRRAVAEARLTGYVTATAGQIPLDVAELRSMLHDNMLFIPATVSIGLILIWWLFRRPLAVGVSGIAVGAVVSCTVAFYVLAGQPFTLISSIIPPLLSALTIAALVHFFNALHYAAQRGLTGRDRTRHALEEIRRPTLFTMLTTAAGLASLGTSPIKPVAVFGLLSGAGVVLIYLVVIHLVPNLTARLDRSPWPSERGGLVYMDRAVGAIYRLGVRYPGWVAGGLGLLLALGAPALWRVQVETNFQEFFHPRHPIRQATDRVEAKLSGTTSLDVAFETAQADGLKDPARLRLMRRFQTWAETQPEVDKTFSAADLIEEMNWGFHDQDPAFRRIPDDRRLIGQYLFVYDGNDLYDLIDPDFRLARVNLSLHVHSANHISAVMERIRAWLTAHPVAGLKWDLAGYGRLFADMEDLLVKGQVYSLWGALLLIFGLMVVLWRSFGSALLCMIPNLAPILLIFIIMGLFGIWLDMATAMIASVAVGIAVDDTIHVYHGFRRRTRMGLSPVTAVARTYGQAGRAVMTTSIILSAQFLILVTSQFVPTAHFGLLTSIGLVAALLFDLLLMPALLILLFHRRRRGELGGG